MGLHHDQDKQPGGRDQRFDYGKILVYDTGARRLIYAGLPVAKGATPPERIRWWRRALLLDRETGTLYGTESIAPYRMVRYDPRTNEFRWMNTQLKERLISWPTTKSPDGAFWLFDQAGNKYKFFPEQDLVGEYGKNRLDVRYIMNMALSPGGRYLYYISETANGGGHGLPLVQYDTVKKRKKVIAFLEDFYVEKYGYAASNTYGVSLSADAASVFTHVNGRFAASREQAGYGRPAIYHIHIPASERADDRVPSRSGGATLVPPAALPRRNGQPAPPLPQNIIPCPVVADIDFAEGPAFDSQGNLYFVNYIRNGTIGRKTPDGAVSVWVDLEPGQPNGLKVDAEDHVLVADFKGKRLLRISPDRRVEVLADSLEGQPLLGLNDLCLDQAGNIYFTTPFGSTLQNPIGVFYRFSKDRRLTRLDGGLAFPNGIVVSPDQKRIYVGESRHNRVLVYDLNAGGTVSGKRTFHQFPNDTVDGMDFHEYGRLGVARWTNKTVDVLTPDGELAGSVPAGGDQVTNLAWWGKKCSSV